MFKGDSYPQRWATCLHSHYNNNSHLLRKVVRKIPSSMDLDTKRKWVLRVILQAQQTACHKDQPLQHLHIHHKLEDHPELHQLTIRTKITRIHGNAMEPPMDPLEHLQNLVKAQDLLKERTRHRNLTLEHHQVQVLLHNLLDHLKTQ